MKTINQARFQDLVNHLLHIQGRTFIGAPGSVVGKEKTSKGSPDSFFKVGDSYVFVESTTKEKLGKGTSFHEKLMGDIRHCFNTDETGITSDQISEVVLACTETINAEQDKELRELTASFNPQVVLTLLNIQNLPLYIYDFPGLSEQYVGVVIVKGEIYTLPDFLTKTAKGLQPSLTNEFVGRTKELEDSISSLKIVDVLLLSGPAGVGKSKLAISVLQEMAKSNFIPIVIQSSAVPLWDDFVNLFQNGKNYIILFDDANKSAQNLAYLLDFIQKPKVNSLKVVITSRDYVKQQVISKLSNSLYKEITLGILKDEEIKDIILKVLPNLKYHPDIQRRIIDLSKGNARVALMATRSVTPNAATNYLSSPALLYEKYFEKLAEEISAFSKPITLQAIAIISFFGLINKKDEKLQKELADGFGIDWNELWSAIMELHTQEILDVYEGELVKVADQVLATYAFYKCFLDKGSAVIDYGKWIAFYLPHPNYESRIRNTLIDVNNTFNYSPIKELVVPHLHYVAQQMKSDEEIYKFYSMFWFYKGYDTLKYLREWIKSLPQVSTVKKLVFHFENNDHTRSTEYFELLIQFWSHPNELLEPSISLAIELVAKQGDRLPEFLKFINDYFNYRVDDLQMEYVRQHKLLDVLDAESRSSRHKEIADGTFLKILEVLFGIHFTQFGPAKGHAFTYYNFDLPYNPALVAIREKMLVGLIKRADFKESNINRVLEKIVFPGGNLDKKIYIDELPLYEQLIAEKFSSEEYSHCKFVKRLAKNIEDAGGKTPKSWDAFVGSDIMKLYEMLRPQWDRSGKSALEQDQERRKMFEGFVIERTLEELESYIYKIDKFYAQLDQRDRWMVEGSATEIFIASRLKGKNFAIKILRLFLTAKISVPINSRICYFLLNDVTLSGSELLELLEEFDFTGKSVWLSTFFTAMPKEQIDSDILNRLISFFGDHSIQVPLSRMMDFEKYQDIFSSFQKNKEDLEGHNIISYLTSLILEKPTDKVYLGWNFCQECAAFFERKLPLLKKAYTILKQTERNFDYDGKELEALLEMDNNFFVEYLESTSVDFNYLTFRFEDIRTDYIWKLPNYSDLITKSLEIIIGKSPIFSDMTHAAVSLFNFDQENHELVQRAKRQISEYLTKNYNDQQRVMMLENIVLSKFRGEYVEFLRELLLLQKDVEFLQNMFFSASGGIATESHVSTLQNQIDLCLEIIDMIKGLPDILDYSDHVDYMEQKIIWTKESIQNELKRDFYDM